MRIRAGRWLTNALLLRPREERALEQREGARFNHRRATFPPIRIGMLSTGDMLSPSKGCPIDGNGNPAVLRDVYGANLMRVPFRRDARYAPCTRGKRIRRCCVPGLHIRSSLACGECTCLWW